ncbi:hypothetical protein LTR97_004183 [Elasticomyces elasticus]|uniref:Uncharacterized protein n=1 Tax=Elasticomyces elasticus TaxID=574655 RepID=A0AAN7ZV05_9PEZI|nr:hypothetical protein LTR97_004183 [Elasticomyces elasticus]
MHKASFLFIASGLLLAFAQDDASSSGPDQIVCGTTARSSVISDDDFAGLAMNDTIFDSITEICRAGDIPYCNIPSCGLGVVVNVTFELLFNNSAMVPPDGGSADTSVNTCTETLGNIVTQCIGAGFTDGSVANKSNVFSSVAIQGYTIPAEFDSSGGSLFFNTADDGVDPPLVLDQHNAELASMFPEMMQHEVASEPITLDPTAPVADAFTTLGVFTVNAPNATQAITAQTSSTTAT